MSHVILKIGHVSIGFTYHSHHYFNNDIFSYEDTSTKEVDYELKVHLVNQINHPNVKYQRLVDQRQYYYTDDLMVISVYHDKSLKIITQQIVYRRNDKKADIYLHNELIKNLALQEYVLSGIVFLEMMIGEGFLPLHASGIAHQDDAILFSGPSQVGKSTHVNYWMKSFHDVTIINDDKPLIYFDGHKHLVYGSPFCGKDGKHRNIHKPLKAICFLSQGPKTRLEPMDKKDLLPIILDNTLRPSHPLLYKKLLEMIDRLMTSIPIYKLIVPHDIKAAEKAKSFIYKGI